MNGQEREFGRSAIGLPEGNPPSTDPIPLEWHHMAKVLREEAWRGRWEPLAESNVSPLAGITAEALINGFEQLGLRLVAVEAEQPATDGRQS